jgi:cytoskeleton protein RodZ
LFEIGGSLAAARKGQGLTPSDAERLTRLRGKYLVALENDDFEALPGRVYARAFLRTYADALGLDADRFVDEFDVRYPQPVDEPQVSAIPVRRRRRLGPRALLGLLVAAAIVGVVVWSVFSPPGKQAPVTAPAGPVRAAPAVHRRAPLALPTRVVHRRLPLVISATRGPCWLQVRRGGALGPVLFEGTLERGTSRRFLPRVWVRLGAPANVSIHRGTHVVRGLPVTTPVNITA